MTGQGRPSSSASACARDAPTPRAVSGRGRRKLATAIALILCALFVESAAAQEEPAGSPLRLRITWGGGEASSWFGRLWLDDGSLADLKLLGLAADSAGSIWLEDGKVHVASLSSRELDAIEIAATSGKASQLLIELSPEAAKVPAQIKVPLSEVLRRPYDVRLDDRGNTLHIEVVPNDALRVVMDRDSMIFSPGEQFAFELLPQLPEMAPGTTLDIHTTLSPARRNETLWSDEQRLAVPVEGAPKVTLNVPLPRTEGVYTIRVAATRPPGFRTRFFPGAAAPLAKRTFDIVVLDARPPHAPAAAEWKSVLEIDPTSPRWWERLPNWTQLRRIPGLNRGPLGSIRAGAVDLALGRFVELPPTVVGAEPHWQAYSLPLEAVDVPHLLEIDYPAEDEQHFGISIVEPNAAGVVEGIGRDSGVYVEGFGRGEAKQPQTHRMVFWPRTQAPLLLVTNQHPTAAAHFGNIRVLKRSTGQLTSTPAARSPSERLVAAYLARPLLAEAFGASQGLDTSIASVPSGTKTVDDWQTFYEGATRLSEYVRYGGYNSAVVSVLADGSSIYPSSHLSATPLYNTGRAASDANQRDGLELLLRVFDRDGLALLPALQFAAPLPELEKLRRGSNPQTSGLEWVGPDGRTWLQSNGAKDGLVPYYNLLEPRVQQAILQVVRELVERYGRHPAFAGLSIQLSANSYAQLPPLDWGLDDATISRFERDTGIQLAASGPNRFAARHALLTGEHAEAWRAWRTTRVAEFYAQVAGLVRASKNDRRLILTLEESFANPQLAARVRPNILLAKRVETALLDAGIDRQRLENAPGVVVCATRYVESMTPLPERAVDFELNDAFAAWTRQADSAAGPAALLYHRPQRRRVASFEAKSPFKIEGDSQLVCQPLAHGAAVRQPYVRTILQHDPAVLIDGGELLPLGQEELLREVRTIVRQLPTIAEVTEVAKQPVMVRTYAEPNAVTLLVVNACPWHAEAEVTLQVPQAATMEPLVPDGENVSAPAPRALAAGQQPWSLSLEPYAVEAVRIATPGVRVIDIRAEASNAAKAELAMRLADLANRDLTAPRLYSMLSNPSFEPLSGAGPASGWRLSVDTATAELDATNPQDGKTCLYFRNEGALAAIESDPIPMPPTGQLAMTVHVRDQKIAPGSELRMVFEAVHAGQIYRRSAIVAAANPAANPVAGQWQYKAILVNDLPLESPGEMRVRFELSGPGEVWLDSVKLYDLLFPLKFYKYEEAEILQFVQLTHAAKSAFDEGRIADCVRLLERYWPRFLAEYTPPIQPAIATERTQKADPASSSPANQNQEPAPGITERIKRAIPFVR